MSGHELTNSMGRRVCIGHCSWPRNDLQTMITALGNAHSLEEKQEVRSQGH